MEKEIIWQAMLDKRYGCTVVRLNESQGRLVVADEDKKEVLLDKIVGLSYGAKFGPDISDIGYWEDLCLETVDGKK